MNWTVVTLVCYMIGSISFAVGGGVALWRELIKPVPQPQSSIFFTNDDTPEERTQKLRELYCRVNTCK